MYSFEEIQKVREIYDDFYCILDSRASEYYPVSKHKTSYPKDLEYYYCDGEFDVTSDKKYYEVSYFDSRDHDRLSVLLPIEYAHMTDEEFKEVIRELKENKEQKEKEFKAEEEENKRQEKIKEDMETLERLRKEYPMVFWAND